MNTAYIALGSNMGDRIDHLRKAKKAIEREVTITATSPIYDTVPIETGDTHRFLNAVVAVNTQLSPDELLSLCLRIEKEHGRNRPRKNAPRTLDLDLILYGDLAFDSPELTLPHPRMHERAFVLAPLADIDPSVVHPILEQSARELLMQCGDTELLVQQTDYTL